MFYIHQSICISPQITFPEAKLEKLELIADNKLYAKEVSYEGIPNGMLRRMGKAVRLGVAASLPVFKEHANLDGIVIGTAYGGMEDCIKFLNQVIEYEEGRLTPTNFVQSTTNAIASQLGFMSKNKGYNITHVQRGLSFENAVIDVIMLLEEDASKKYILGGLDEISEYNFNIDNLNGCFKKDLISNKDLYETKTEGSIAGEGVAMFVVNKEREGASSKVLAIKTIHTEDEKELKYVLNSFLKENGMDATSIDLLLSGENGDVRYQKYYDACESSLGENINVARFKHLCGEYQTSTAFALWFADKIIQTQAIPEHAIKTTSKNEVKKTILIYNNYLGLQHSFTLLSAV